MAKLRDRDIEQYLAESVVIDPLALQEEFVRMPSDIAYWNERYSDAYRASLLAKAELERAEAILTIQTREELILNGNARPTELVVTSTVTNDARYQAARGTYVEAEVERVRVNGILDALRTKREMLVSLGAHIRAEMRGEPTIRE